MSLGDFVIEVALFAGLAMAVALPVLVVAHRRGKTEVVRSFLVAGMAVALVAATLSATSDALMSRCRDAGNTGCLDYGMVGFQTLIFLIYGVVSLAGAVRLLRS